MKKHQIATLIVILFFSITFIKVALASNQIRLVINGREIKPDVSPQLINGRIMVPLRWVAEALGAQIKLDEHNNVINIIKPYSVADLPEAGIKLYPFKDEDGMFDGFIIEVNKDRKYFDWKNVDNPTFPPQIYFCDLNHDGEKELIAILTTGTGTGIHEETIHIIDPKTLSEKEVENPFTLIGQKVKAEIIKGTDKDTVKLDIDGQSYSVNLEKNTAGDLFDEVFFGNSYYYSVNNDELVAHIGVQVSATTFIGTLEVMYEGFAPKKIEFKAYM